MKNTVDVAQISQRLRYKIHSTFSPKLISIVLFIVVLGIFKIYRTLLSPIWSILVKKEFRLSTKLRRGSLLANSLTN